MVDFYSDLVEKLKLFEIDLFNEKTWFMEGTPVIPLKEILIEILDYSLKKDQENEIYNLAKIKAIYKTILLIYYVLKSGELRELLSILTDSLSISQINKLVEFHERDDRCFICEESSNSRPIIHEKKIYVNDESIIRNWEVELIKKYDLDPKKEDKLICPLDQEEMKKVGGGLFSTDSIVFICSRHWVYSKKEIEKREIKERYLADIDSGIKIFCKDIICPKCNQTVRPDVRLEKNYITIHPRKQLFCPQCKLLIEEMDNQSYLKRCYGKNEELN